MLTRKELGLFQGQESFIGTRSNLPLSLQTHSILYKFRDAASVIDNGKVEKAYVTTTLRSYIFNKQRLKKGETITPIKIPPKPDTSYIYALDLNDISALKIGNSTIRFGEREGLPHMVGPQGQFIDLPPNMPVGIGTDLAVNAPGAGRLELYDEPNAGPLHAVVMTVMNPETKKRMILVENIDPALFDISFISQAGTTTELRRNQARLSLNFQKVAVTSHGSLFKPKHPNPDNTYGNHDYGLVHRDTMVVTDGMGLAKGSDIAARFIAEKLMETASNHTTEQVILSFPEITTQLHTYLTDRQLDTKRGASYAVTSIWKDEVNILWGGDVRVYHYHKKDGSVNRVTLDDNVVLDDFNRYYQTRFPKDPERARYLATILAEDIAQHAYDPALSPEEAIEKSKAIIHAHGISEVDMQNTISPRLAHDGSTQIPWSYEDMYRRTNLITKYISGTNTPEPNQAKIHVERGDEIYILTDGIYRGLTQEEIAEIAHRKISPKRKSEAFINTSEKRKLRRDQKIYGATRRLMRSIARAFDPALARAQDDDRTAAVARIGY